MVDVEIEDAAIIFRVCGTHKLWTFRSELRIPAAHVTGVRRESVDSPFLRGWRNFGTWVPGVLTAGSYQLHGTRIFYDVSNWERIVVIDLEDEKFTQLVIEVADPAQVVRRLKELQGASTPNDAARAEDSSEH